MDAHYADNQSGRLRRRPPQQVLTALDKALALVRDHSKWSVYFAYEKASLQRQLGQYGPAAETLRQVRIRFPDEGYNRQQRGEFLVELLRVQGRIGEAFDEIRELDSSCDEDDKAARATIHGLRAQIYQEIGLIERAARELREETRLADASQNAAVVYNALLRQAEFSLITEQLSDVRQRIDDYLAKLESAPDPVSPQRRAELLLYRGVAETGAARVHPEQFLQAARATLKEAIREPTLGHSLQVVARLRLLDLALMAGDFEDARRHAAAGEELFAGPDGASKNISRSRDYATFAALQSRLYLDEGRGVDELKQQLARHTEAFEGFLAHWGSIPLRRGGVGFLQLMERRVVLSQLIELILAIAAAEGRTDGPSQALEPLLAAQAMGTLARARKAPKVDAETVRRSLLAEDCGALVFLPSHRCTHLFTIERDAVRHHRLESGIEVMRRVRDLRSLLAWHPGQAAETPSFERRVLSRGRRVRDALLPEAIELQLRNWAGVTFVGGDLLGGVPFECLPLRGGDALLGEALAVDNLASLPLGVQLAREELDRRPRRAQLELTFLATLSGIAKGAEPAKPGRQPFPVNDDTRAIWASYRGEPEKLLDGGWTRAAFREQDLAGQHVIHMVAHSHRAPEGEVGGALAVADGVLGPSDLDGKSVRGLVILSACASGQGANRPGDGLLLTSLGGEFLWRGAHTVIVSKSELLLSRHLSAMALLHSGLTGEGLSPAAAMQRVRKALAARGDLTTRFYRGQLQVFGLGQLPLAR